MKQNLSYCELLKKAQQYEIDELGEMLSHEKYKFNLPRDNSIPSYLAPASYILDYTKGKYVYATSTINKFIDHPLSKFLDGGVEFGVSLFHKQDLSVYSNKVMAGNLDFLNDIPVELHQNYLFTCNYRVINKRGDYRNVVQRSVFIKSSETGMPLATFGFLFDITNFRNDNRVYHSIESLNDEETDKLPLISNIYFNDERDTLLSKREIEVLKYICDDLESEQIASKLFISRHTVDNHRRKLLEKTNSRSSAGLVAFAFSNGYV
jgi:DNA-binding CsgD family transcriptional regulator